MTNIKNTIREQHLAMHACTIFTVYTLDTVCTVDTVDTVYTIQTALHCLNISMYAYIYCQEK